MTTPISRTPSPPPTLVIGAMGETLLDTFRSHLPKPMAALLPRNALLIPATKWLVALALYYHSLAALTLYLATPYLIDPVVSALSPYYEEAQSSLLRAVNQTTLNTLQIAAQHCPNDDKSLYALIHSAPTITAQFATTLLEKVPEEERREKIGSALIFHQQKVDAEVLQAILTAIPSLTELIVECYPLMTTRPQHTAFYALSVEASTQFISDTLFLSSSDEREQRLSTLRSIHPTHPLFNNPQTLLAFLNAHQNLPRDALGSLFIYTSPSVKKDPDLISALPQLLGPDFDYFYDPTPSF